MANSTTWSRHASLAMLILVAFFTIFFNPGLYPDKQLQGDELAGLAFRHRRALDLLKDSLNHTDDLVLRAPKPITSAADDLYNQASEKGKLLKCWMKNPSAAGAQGTSRWNDYDALKDWGWRETTTTHHGGESTYGFSNIVGHFGNDDWTNENKEVRFEHKGQHPDQEITQPDGSRVTVSYPPTNGVYENRLYPSRGVIIAEWNWNPRYMIEGEQTSKGRDWDSATMRQPDLFQMSDFWWFMWKKYTSTSQRSGLHFVAKHNIVNEPTQQVMARALRQRWPDEELPSIGQAPLWPGKVFTPDMEEFAPLLGIPSIWGIPFFLIQHHGDDELGRLEVKKITLFVDIIASYYQPNAIVEVGAVEEE